MARATIFDVAKLAGVSIKTVSRVVNHEPNVRESTKERVDDAIAELNYRPDQSARNLASHRSNLIGLVYDDPSVYELPSSGYIVKMQQGALKVCQRSGAELLIHPCNYRDKDIEVQLKDLCEQARPAGIILAAPLSNMQNIVRAIAATNTPFVRLSPGTKKCEQICIATNDREFSAEMTTYLASLGHKRIAFISGHPKHKAVGNRLLGYKDGLKQSGLDFSEELVCAGDNSFGSGEICARALLEKKNPPTAIFAANDDMAAAAARVAAQMGVDVPGELSIAGCDDISLARQMSPSLTTIRQPLVSMAEKAAMALVKGAHQNSLVSRTEVVPATLQIRQSTGPAPR
jgi:LacI family transcriptional regulator